MIDHFLTKYVEVCTNVINATEGADGEVTTGLVAYQGTLVDCDETWIALGTYDFNDEPVHKKIIKITELVSIEVVEDEIDEEPASQELN